MNESALKALVLYLRDSSYGPVGQTDKGGRWYPGSGEKCTCCESIRPPSRDYPWSLWKHCKSAKHIRTVLTETIPCAAYVTALNMTRETAPLYINDSSPAVVAVAHKLLGK